MGYLKVQAVTGVCPVCHVSLGEVPVAELKMSSTAPALQLLRGCGHLVVLSGNTWLVRCAADQHNRLSVVKGVGPDDSPAVVASAATQRQGARRR